MRAFFLTLSLLASLVLLSACGGSTSSSSDTATAYQVENGNGSISVEWIAPSTRTDGSSMPPHELAGYRIYIGESSNNLSPLVDLADNSITEYLIRNIAAGSYYLAISSYDTDGLEGPLTQPVLFEAS